MHLGKPLFQMIDAAQLAGEPYLPDGHQIVADRLVQIAVERAEKLLEKRSHEKSAPEKREEKQRGNEAPKRKRREDVSL